MEINLEQLPLKEGAIIMWRTGDPTPGEAEWLSQELHNLGFGRCVLVILRPEDSLSILSDEDLDRAGLQRK